MTTKTIRSDWTSHPGQTAVMNSRARFRVGVFGRRWGKNVMAAHEVVTEAIEAPGSLIWWVGPTYDDANDYGFDMVRPLVPDDLLDRKPKRSKPRKLWVNGTEIAFQSAEHELKGAGLDLLVVDESGSIPRRTIENDLRPMLTDTGGSVLALGRPRGRNWFFGWFQRGQSPDWPEFASWQAPTSQNPHIDRGEVAAARREMPERVFRQEWLAEFVDDSGGVFQDVRSRVGDHSVPMDPADVVPPVAFGVDLGRAENYTAIVGLDATGRVVHFDRVRHTSWSRIESAVTAACERYEATTVALDATRDNKLVGDVEDDTTARVVAVNFGGGSKRDMIESLATALERDEVVLPEDEPVLTNELEIYEYSTTPAGNIKYHAPESDHDDAVDALSLAWKASDRAARSSQTYRGTPAALHSA
jgi:hypothetical protein